MHEFEQKGAIGVIAVNPGADVHWGICTSIWGTPDLDDLPRKPGIPVVAVNNPDGQELIALAENGGRATIVTEMEEGWYPQKVPVVEIKGTRRAGEVRAGARPLRQLGRRRRRQRDRRRDAARARARALEEPQEAEALGAHRLVAGPLDRPLCGLDLVRRCVRDRPRRELRRAGQLRLARLPLGHDVQGRVVDAGDRSLRAVRHQGGDRACRAMASARTAPATTRSTISAFRASSCCPRPCRTICAPRRATTRSAAAAGTSPGTPRTT